MRGRCHTDMTIPNGEILIREAGIKFVNKGLIYYSPADIIAFKPTDNISDVTD